MGLLMVQRRWTRLVAGLAVVLVLAIAGCKPKDPPLEDYTEFYGAILHGEYETVERLLKKYPTLVSWEFNFGGYQGDPLMTAALSDSPDIVALLLEAGAEPNYYANDGMTPLMVAVQHERTRIVEQLLKAGADVTKKTESESTVLHYLGQFPNPEIADLLLPISEAIIDEPKDGNFTPLTVALSEYHNDLAFRFIEAGASLEKALAPAPHIIPEFVLNNNREMLDYFWEQGVIDPYAVYQGYNLFHYACWYGNVEFVQELLDRGLWDDTPNPAGYTPLDLAREYGHQEIIDLVEEAGLAER